MNDLEKRQALNKLFEDEGFLQKIGEAESKNDLQDVFGSYGVDLTCDEIDAFVSIIERVSTSGELSEDELAEVAGGVDPWTVLITSFKAVKSVAKYAWNAGKKFANWEQKR